MQTHEPVLETLDFIMAEQLLTCNACNANTLLTALLYACPQASFREEQTYHFSGDALVSGVHAAVSRCTEHASCSRNGVDDSANREAVLVNCSSVVIQGLANLQSKRRAQPLATSAANFFGRSAMER